MMGSHGLDVIADLSEWRVSDPANVCVLQEYKNFPPPKTTQGLSWSIGMDDKGVTVPNFLRTYNPHIVGGSLGHHFTEV